MSATIRLATLADARPLAALKLATFRATFVEGFCIPYPPADLASFERDSYGAEKVAAELVDPTHRTWLAEQGDRFVGYAHAGPCKLPYARVRPGDGELYQLYLAADVQGSGIGRGLLDTVLEHFRSPVWLGVWSGNLKAQAFYTRAGFTRISDYLFPVGDWMDEEHIYRRG